MKYKHKTTVIEEVEDRRFLSEGQAVAVQDMYKSESQTVDILNIGTVDSTIEGMGQVNFSAKSMVNLFHRTKTRYRCEVGYKKDGSHNTSDDYTITTTPDDISVKFGNIDKGFSYIYFFIGANRPGTVLMPGKKYTFFIDIYTSENYPVGVSTSIKAGNGSDPMTDTIKTEKLKPGWNRIRTVMTCFDNGRFTSRDGKSVYIWITDLLKLANMEIIMKNAMLIEGDIPMSEYPGYFEGYRSIADEPVNVTVHGSNHIDMNKITFSNASIIDKDPSKGYIAFKKTDSNSGTFIKYENFKVKPNTYYSVSYDITCNGSTINKNTFIYDENSKYYGSHLVNGNITEFNTGDWNSVNIGIFVGSGISVNSVIKITNFRINEGRVALPFEPYKENTFILDALSLKELPTGVKDTLEGNKLTRRVGKIILDGSEHWGLINETIPSDSKTIGFSFSTTNKPEYNMKHINKHFSDTFMNYGTNAMYGSGDFEQIGTWSHGGSINIRISRNKSVKDVASFKNWLKNCPVTVYYELAEPTVEYVDMNRIGTYSTKTHIKTDSNFSIPMRVTTSQNILDVVNDMKHEVIEQNNKLSSIKNIQLAVLANLI